VCVYGLSCRGRAVDTAVVQKDAKHELRPRQQAHSPVLIHRPVAATTRNVAVAIGFHVVDAVAPFKDPKANIKNKLRPDHLEKLAVDKLQVNGVLAGSTNTSYSVVMRATLVEKDLA